MATISIQPYTANHERALLMLIAEHQDYHRALEPQWPPGSAIAKAYLDFLQRECDEHDGCVLLAIDGAAIAGFVCVAAAKRGAPDDPAPHGYVHDLFVAPAHRRRGLAKALMGAAEEFVRSRQVAEIRLAVLERNADARTFYDALGFRDYVRILTKPLL